MAMQILIPQNQVRCRTRIGLARTKPGHTERGFTYVVAMFLVALSSVLVLGALRNTQTTLKRNKEAQLLAIGQAYRTAIQNYYENSPGSSKTYPADLNALLLDTRTTRITRPLRKLYRDPITGDTQWGLVRSESGGIMGVYSLSTQKPYKTDGFPSELALFKNATQYQQWQFIYVPQPVNTPVTSGTTVSNPPTNNTPAN